MLFLDGGMGTQLQENGLELGGIPEMLNFTNPELITSIHRRYIDAGSDIVYTNSFGANRFKMSHTDKSVSEIIKAAIKNAKNEECICFQPKPGVVTARTSWRK